jgi:5-hydroxyisourate hydrolase-like protein (transthyretin family)
VRLSVRFIAVAVICLAAMVLPCLAQQPAASANPADHDNQFCTVAGTILSANTGEPLKKAQITIYKDEGDNEPHPQTASSDASGHFSIDHLAAGRYELRVSRVGYLDTQYGQDKPDKPGAVLTLIAGQKMTDLLFRMQRTAVIAGRITDEDSEPAREAPVEAFSRTIVRGKPKIERVGAGRHRIQQQYRDGERHSFSQGRSSRARRPRRSRSGYCCAAKKLIVTRARRPIDTGDLKSAACLPGITKHSRGKKSARIPTGTQTF